MRTGGNRGWGGFVVVLVGGFVAAFFFGRTTTPAEFEPRTPGSTPGGAGLNYDHSLEDPAAEAAAPETEVDPVAAARVAELQREIAVYEQLAERYEVELRGGPAALPADPPGER